MNRADTVIEWFQSHKAAIGAFFLSLATIVAGTGTIYSSDDLVHAAAVIALVGGALSGAGMAKSDQFYRERKEVLETGVDRRAPSNTMPTQDRRKLAAETKAGK